MTDRAQQLHLSADRQVAQLIALLEATDEVTLRLPCAGREKLGDGTIAALLGHTAENYRRIAGFVTTSERMSTTQPPHSHGIDRLCGRGPTDHQASVPSQYDSPYSADNLDIDLLIELLSDTRAALGRIAELTDRQLDAIPSKDSFRFCDGQRTLEQVIGGLLKHQARQAKTLAASIA